MRPSSFTLGRQMQLEVRLISEKILDGLGRLKSPNAMETSSKRSAKDNTKARLRKGSILKLKQSGGELKKLLSQLTTLKE